MRIVAAQGLRWLFSCLGIPYGAGIASVAHDHSCYVESSDPPVYSMDSLEPPDEVPPGESALLQQVTVQMRKPFEPNDSLPENMMVLELADGHSGGGTVQPAISPKTIPKSSSGQARTASQNAALASAIEDQDDSVSPSSVKASAARNVAKQDDARSLIEHSPLKASSAPHKPNQHATRSFDEPANVPGTLRVKNEFAVHSSIAPAPARTSAVPVAINRDVLHSSTVELMSERTSAVAPVANKDVIDSLIATSKHRSHAETQKSESNKINRHESRSLQVLVEDHMEHQELEPGESKVNESKKELGLQASTRWLEMMHVGEIIQRGRRAISYEIILLFCVISIASGCFIWAIVTLSSSTSSPDHNEDQNYSQIF